MIALSSMWDGMSNELNQLLIKKPQRFNWCCAKSVKWWLQLRFDCNSTALRPFGEIRHERAAGLRPR